MSHNKYPCEVISVYDGDTIKVMINLWPQMWKETNLRLMGIDTPEWRTRNLCEKAMAETAKGILISFLEGKELYATDVFLGKYSGRVIGNLFADDVDASEFMLKTGYAIEYAGGKRTHVWC